MPDAPQLLIVDDETAQLQALCITLGDRGYAITGCGTVGEALAILATRDVDMLLTDLRLPDGDGIELLQAALKINPNLVGVLMTGHGTIGTAVEAMKLGALDYILKPFKLSEVLPVLSRALTVRRLRQEKAELERRVDARTRELEAANQDLDAFARSVSHDLRAPARAVASYSQLLLDEASPHLSDLHQALLRHVHQNAANMGELIDGLLRFSQLGRHPIDKKPVPMTQLVTDVVSEVRDQYRGRDVDVTIEDLPECQADANLIRHVLVNLVSNAFKYTAKTEHARVRIGSEPHGEDVAYVVQDNGAGFDMRYAGKLFGVFQRLHPPADFEGTGVGLSIAHRIVERHGGRMWAEAEVGKGATFFFTLP
jgi:two-component system, sensor histidine kinase and response regulator